jgi:hypothetical protein
VGPSAAVCKRVADGKGKVGGLKRERGRMQTREDVRNGTQWQTWIIYRTVALHVHVLQEVHFEMEWAYTEAVSPG